MVEDRDDGRGVGAPAGASRRLEACQSPVWDTALAIVALSDAGVAADDPAIVRAARVAARRGGHDLRGDWSVATTGAVTRRLGVRVRQRQLPRRRRHRRGRARAAAPRAPPSADARRGGRRARRGAGWRGCRARTAAGARSTPRTRARSCASCRSCDFGEVIDEPSADVTAHAVEMLAALGLADTPAAPAAIRWLIDQQEPDGSWFGRWGVNHVYGTGAAVPALIAAGVVARRIASRARCAGCSSTRTTTADGARTRAPTTIRRGSVAGRAPRRRPPGRCSRCTPRASAARRMARRGLAGRDPAPGRRLGRAAVHRHRLSVGTTTSTTTSTA